MSDVIIFAMGCLFSSIVACAVGLLLWGAANEPRGELLPENLMQDSQDDSISKQFEKSEGLRSQSPA